MKFTGFVGLTLLSIAATSSGVSAQSAKDLVGTWQHVANVNAAPDGKKSDAFGPNPKGMAIFTADGHFMITNLRADLPKFAGNNRAQGTDAENKAVVEGSVALYGTYSVADKAVNLNVDDSNFPNWRGTKQKRELVTLNSDELKWKVAAASRGGQSEVTWKRVK